MNATKPLHWQHSAALSLKHTTQATDWDRLNRLRGDLPFMDAGAICLALEHFGSGNEVLSVARDDAGVAQAMVVLQPRGTARWASFQPSQLPLGAWVATAELSPAAICQSLLRQAPTGIGLLVSLTQIDPRLAPREPDPANAVGLDYIDTGWIDVEGSFDSYWAARGKNLRQNMRKQRNKLATDGVSTQLHLITEPTEMAGALARYGSLEGTGWKAGEGTAILADNAQGHFYLSLFEAAAHRGEARVYEYRFDNKTVAMNLCLWRGGQLIVLKTAYDESFRTLSPAFLLREEELQQFFQPENAVHRIEYYGKLMDWHTKLTDNKRTLYHHSCYRWGWLKAAALWRSERAARAAKSPVSASSVPSTAPQA